MNSRPPRLDVLLDTPFSNDAIHVFDQAAHRLEDLTKEHQALELGAAEFAYLLAEDLERGSCQPLSDWRKLILGKAIESRDDWRKLKRGMDIDSRDHGEHWTNGYGRLGASDEETLDSVWRRTPGLLRICLVQKCIGVKCSSGSPLQGEFTGLLPHFVKSLKEDVRYTSRKLVGKSPDEAGFEWDEAVFQFPNDIALRFVSNCFLLDKRVPNDVLKDICAKRNEIQADGTESGDVLFWVVLDTIDDITAQLDSRIANYVFRHLCGTGAEPISPDPIDPSGLLQGGVIGLEGTVIIRRMLVDVSNQLKPSAEDSCWGGSAWAAWMITIYQRAACEDLATETAELGSVLADPGKARKLRSQFDVISKLQSYWNTVIQLESKWMYREIAQVSDVDRLYRSFQTSYDIEKMWGDVREQTELIARYAETERNRKVTKVQTTAGIILGSLVLLSGVMGMNFFDTTELKLMIPWGGKMTVIVFFIIWSFGLLASLYWWWREASSRSGAVQIRKYGNLLLELFLFAAVWFCICFWFYIYFAYYFVWRVR